MEKLTVNELFSGIGAQRKAFERLGIPHEVVGVSEIDKYAIQSYEAIFGATRNYGDICTAPRLDYADLWTYSFPCQDISVSGKQKGLSEGTRSGLLYQVQRLLEVAKAEGTLPKYLLLENVKNLVGKKFKSQFDNWLFYLDQLGYDTYWQVLNAKNYGIPQNRERVFAVSILKCLNQKYEFPKPETLTKRLADILEDEVDEKFYLSQDKVNTLIRNLEKSNSVADKVVCKERSDEGLRFFKDYAIGTLRTIDACGDKRVIELPCVCASRGRNPENPSDRTVGAPTQQRLELNFQGVSNTITTVQKDNYVVESKIIQVGNIVNTGNWNNLQRGRIYSAEGLSPALNTVGGGGLEPKIIEVGHYTYPNSDKKHQSNVVYSAEGLAPTLDTMQGGSRTPKIIIDDTQQGFNGIRCYANYAPTLRASRYGLKTNDGIRIRKLTPLECWRLMGFDDEDFYKAQQSGVSNSQLYKQAGNSIVVDVLEKIFKNIIKESS